MATDPNSSAMTAAKMQEAMWKVAADKSLLRDGGHSHIADALLYGSSLHKHSYSNALNTGAVAGSQRQAATELSPNTMREMIRSRMRWLDGALTPFKALEARALSSEQAVVFVITGEKAVLLYDDIELFPSDALVTQLRLLEN